MDYAILGLAGLVAGFFFWPYWVSTLTLTSLAKGLRPRGPAELFFSACGVQILMTIFVGMVAAAGEGALAVLLCFFGWIGWVTLWVGRGMLSPEVHELRQARPRPKIQFEMRDIYVVVLFFALLMAALVLTLPKASEENLLLCAVYLLFACALGFGAALDILRWARQPKNPWVRLGVVFGCLFYFSLGLILAGLLAWSAWRRVLLMLELERWRDEKKEAPASPN
jgi:hypothetical protein